MTWLAGFAGTSLLAPNGHGTCHRAMSCQPRSGLRDAGSGSSETATL